MACNSVTMRKACEFLQDTILTFSYEIILHDTPVNTCPPELGPQGIRSNAVRPSVSLSEYR